MLVILPDADRRSVCDMDLVYPPVIGAARVVFAAQGLSFRIDGDEHVPLTGGAVLAINHTGYFDFTYAGLAAQRSGRLVRFMAKKSIFQHPVAGPLMRAMKHVPVDRRSGKESFDHAVALLRAGEIVGMFPEATMSRSFELRPFKQGAVRMAQAAQVPIIPVTIWGSHRVWSKDTPKRLGRSRIPISIVVGEPIWVLGTADAKAETTALRDTMVAQLHAQQEAYPPLTGADRVFLPARLGGAAPSPREAESAEVADMTRISDKFNRRSESSASSLGT